MAGLTVEGHIVTAWGEFDAANAVALGESLHETRAGGHMEVVVDLRAVTFLDSAALRVLLVAATVLAEDGGRLALVAPTGTAARRLLDYVAADEVATVLDEAPRHRP